MPNFTCVQCGHVHYNRTTHPFECEYPLCKSRLGFTGKPDPPEKNAKGEEVGEDGCKWTAVFLLAVFVMLSASAVAVLAAVL